MQEERERAFVREESKPKEKEKQKDGEKCVGEMPLAGESKYN